MEIFSLICDLIVAICGVIPTIISVFMLVRNIIKTKNWELVTKIANESMSYVESYSLTHIGMTSDEKLDMALNAVKSGLSSAGISFDE